MCTLSVSNVIYHKFSHGAAFYTLNGKNVNVMLECSIDQLYTLSGDLCNIMGVAQRDIHFLIAHCIDVCKASFFSFRGMTFTLQTSMEKPTHIW